MARETNHTPWKIHVAAVLYILPMLLGRVFFDFSCWLFWSIVIPVSLLMLVLIYYRNGQYRQYARLYLLLSFLALILAFVAPHWLSIEPDTILHFIIWDFIVLSCTYIGAQALMSPGDLRALTRRTYGAFYPNSMLPQDIEPVDEPEEKASQVNQHGTK